MVYRCNIKLCFIYIYIYISFYFFYSFISASKKSISCTSVSYFQNHSIVRIKDFHVCPLIYTQLYICPDMTTENTLLQIVPRLHWSVRNSLIQQPLRFVTSIHPRPPLDRINYYQQRTTDKASNRERERELVRTVDR